MGVRSTAAFAVCPTYDFDFWILAAEVCLMWRLLSVEGRLFGTCGTVDCIRISTKWKLLQQEVPHMPSVARVANCSSDLRHCPADALSVGISGGITSFGCNKCLNRRRCSALQVTDVPTSRSCIATSSSCENGPEEAPTGCQKLQLLMAHARR